jgi:von Willebrand factor type A domain
MAQNPRACTDTELVMPIGPLEKSKMYRAVDSFRAKGETPIAYSLQQSVQDLGSSGKRVLVLISDGEETCAKDPCPTARKLAAAGVDLQFNAVGLAVNKKARSQLQCIAEAGDGAYYDASRAGDLSEALRKITQRALRPYALSGTRVKGTEEPAGAPELATGQYVDAYDASSTPRYYRIPRTVGSTVTASNSQPGQSLPRPEHGVLDVAPDHRIGPVVRHHNPDRVILPQRDRPRRSRPQLQRPRRRALLDRAAAAVVAAPVLVAQREVGPGRDLDQYRTTDREPLRAA